MIKIVDDMILCPHCGGVYLHHYRVETFERKEDAKKGLHVIVSGDKIRVNESMKKNPSPRRQGVRILFYCEDCPWISAITIIQYKGFFA